MSEVQIVYRALTNGTSVIEMACPYFLSAENLPTIRLSVTSFMFGKAEEFTFSKHALGVKTVSDERALSHLRASKFSKGTIWGAGAGILGKLISGALAAGTAQLGDLQGLAAVRLNEKNFAQLFVLVAPRSIVADILESMPKEKIAPDWMSEYSL